GQAPRTGQAETGQSLQMRPGNGRILLVPVRSARRARMPVEKKTAAALLKQGLLLFWAVWLSLVLLSNVLDGAKALGLLGASWTFASGNYAFLCQTTARHATPEWVNGVLFAGAIGWEARAAVLF